MKQSILRIKTYPKNIGVIKGIARLEFGDELSVFPIRILDAGRGVFLGMPQNHRRNGDLRDVFHPISAEGRAFLQSCICGTYRADQPNTREVQLSDRELQFSVDVTPYQNPKSDVIGFATLTLHDIFRIENILLRKGAEEGTVEGLFPLRQWVGEDGEVRSAEIFTVKEDFLVRLNEQFAETYQERLKTLTARDEAWKTKPNPHRFDNFTQRDYKKEMGYTLDEFLEMARKNKAEKERQERAQSAEQEQTAEPSEEHQEEPMEEPVMCL